MNDKSFEDCERTSEGIKSLFFSTLYLLQLLMFLLW
jgi:hypothetical protein